MTIAATRASRFATSRPRLGWPRGASSSRLGSAATSMACSFTAGHLPASSSRPLLIALQCWLNVGLFIVAHDCMHGSLAPFRPALNRWIGRLCLALYAGFSYDRSDPQAFRPPPLSRARPTTRTSTTTIRTTSGAGTQPSFAATSAGSRSLSVARGRRDLRGGCSAPALPTCCCYGPCRRSCRRCSCSISAPICRTAMRRTSFADRHNSRSNDFSLALSLLTCFHFGYHHEHHLSPHVPWWDLPKARIRPSERP